MNPMQELVKEAEAMLHHLNDDSFDPSFAGRTHRRREALRAAIPAAQLYAERMGEVVEAAEDVITTLMTDNECKCLNRLHKALASLDSAEVGESAEGGTTSPDVIREAKREAWEEFRDGVKYVIDAPNPYAPPTATAKETNDDES